MARKVLQDTCYNPYGLWAGLFQTIKDNVGNYCQWEVLQVLAQEKEYKILNYVRMGWSFDNYLSNVIWRGLEELKRTSHGYVLINPKKSNRWNEKKWDKILDKIIKGFKKYSKDGITYARLIREDGIKEDPEWTEAKKLFIKYFENFWD